MHMPPTQNYPTQQNFDPNQGQAKKRKIIGAIILVGFLLIIAAVAVALLAGSSGSKQLGLVLARQNEAVRILEEYGEQASSETTKAFTARALVVLKSDATELANAGVSASADQQQAAVVPGIDDVMTDAARSNRLDEVINDYLEETISANQQLAEETLDSTKKENLKLVLQTVVENYKNLL